MSFRKFNGITLKNNATIENLHIERLASDPSVVEAGRLWYNSTDKTIKMSVRNASDSLVVKTFVDDTAFENWKQGLIVKDAVDVVVTDTNVDPTLGLTLDQDGYTIDTGDRLLLNTAADDRNNGIYKVTGLNPGVIPYATKMFATGTDKDTIVISPKEGFGIDSAISLTVASHANGTPASVIDGGGLVQLSLEKVGQRSAAELIVSSGNVDVLPVFLQSLVGGSFKITAKATSPYKHFLIRFDGGNQNRTWDFRSNPVGDIYKVNIRIQTDVSDGWIKTIEEVVAYLNAQTGFSDHLIATVDTDGTKVFGWGGDARSGIYHNDYILKREESYVTTASEILTLINSTERLKATVNGQTTLNPRWVSVFGSTQWDMVHGGSFDNTTYTADGVYLALQLAFTSPFRKTTNPESTKDWFSPNKVRFTFTGTPSLLHIMSSYNPYNQGANYDCLLQTISNPTSGQEITLNLNNGFRMYDSEIAYFVLRFIAPGGINLTNIEFYMGTDYNIYSPVILSEADGGQDWNQVFDKTYYGVNDVSSMSWNGSAFVSTGTGISLYALTDSPFKYNSSALFKATKARISFSPGVADLTLGDWEVGKSVTGYSSGDIVELSPYTGDQLLAGYGSIQLTNAASPVAITNIEFFDGVTGWNPNGRTSMKPGTAAIVRSEDADNTAVNSELKSGVTVFIENGTTYAGTQFTLTTPGNITIGATPITFSQFSSASDISVGPGLERNGNQISIVPDGDSLTISNFGIKLTDGTIRETLMSLDDVPYSIGTPGQYLAVDVNQTGFEFVTPTSTVITAGIGLNKVNDEFSIKLNGPTLSVDVDGLKLNASILHLSDVPDTYGSSGQVLSVNSGGTGFEFTNISSGIYIPNSFAGDSNTVVALRGGGVNGTSTLYDYSLNRLNIISSSNVVYSNEQQKYGSTSIKIPAGEYIKIPHSSVMDISNSNYTFEFDIYISGYDSPTDDWVYLMSSDGRIDGGVNNVEWELGIDGTSAATMNRLYVYKEWPTSNTSAVKFAIGSAPLIGRWIHCIVEGELVNSVHTTRIYYDGVLAGSQTGMGHLPTTNSAIYIGSRSTMTTNRWHGYIDNLRITKGLSRYTEATYTQPTTYYMSTNSLISDAISANDVDLKLDTAVIELKTKLNSNIYRTTSSTPNTQHTITHNLNSDYVDVTVWVYDTVLSKYVNDSVAVTLTSTNALIIDLTESADVKVIVEKKDDIVLS